MSVRDVDLRPGEVAVTAPPAFDAGLYFIGRIATPWRTSSDCPRRGDPDAGPVCQVSVFEPWVAALDGLEPGQWMQILYFMHLSRRDLVRQNPRHEGRTVGTFALRSPVRPNPVASSLAILLERHGPTLSVRGLDCVDGTPLLDIKPERCPRA
jgi:tRNA-Thr(GGU) m(6)t(6)A37 methyltransferase TsaA